MVHKFLRDYQTYFPKEFYNFAFPPAVYENSSSFTFWPTPGMISILCVSHSKGCEVTSHFNLHFPKTCDDEHLTMCLFVILLSFLMKYLLKSLVHLLLGWFLYY